MCQAIVTIRLVIIGRDPAKTSAVISELNAALGGHRVQGLTADLSVMSEVRKVAEQFNERFEALHVLVNNVGAVNLARRDTAEGLEETLRFSLALKRSMTQPPNSCGTRARNW